MAPYSNHGTRFRRLHRPTKRAARRKTPPGEHESPTPDEAQPRHGAATQQLGDVLERVSDALVALDRNWRYTYVNRHAAELFGRRPEDLLGRHIWTLFPEGVGQPFQLAYEKALAEQLFIEIENYYEPWDRWFENRIYPSPEGVSIFFHEITDRKRAEQAARENAALLEGQNQVLQCIARGEPVECTLDVLLRGIEARCPGVWSSILVLNPEGQHAHHAAAPSLPARLTCAIEDDLTEGHAGAFATAALRGEPIVVADAASDPLWEGHRDLVREYGVRASCASPILDAHGDVLGSLALYIRAPGRLSEQHERLMENATRTAAIALTSHRQAEARHASERRLQLAVTGGNVGIWEWDVATNRLFWSDQLKAMFGWSAATADLALETFIDAIHPDDRSRIEDALRRSVAWGVDYDVEYRIVRPDGSVRWIAAKAGGEYAEGSTPVRMMGVALDITERKEAENQLKRSDERFQLMARATNDAVWDWDLVTNTVWWNQGIGTLFGYSEAEVRDDVGWRHGHIHPEDVDRVVSGLRTVTSRREQFWSSEFRFRRANGSFADVFDRGFLVYGSAGDPIRMIGAMADISDRKRAVEMLEKAVTTRTAQLHAKNTELEDEISQRQRVAELLRGRNEELKGFAYTVSHDLKAPLRGIAGYAQELNRRHRTGLNERGAFCVEQILTATRNLDRLIEDLLHYSRLDAETPAPIEVDIAHIVQGILRDCNPAILKSHAEVTVELGVPHVRTWERGLTQILINLIDNALKYSRAATPPLVRIANRSVPNGVRFVVSDNGIGFDMQYHDRIFGLFNRLVRQEEFEGTGAGLAITRKLIEKMNGSVWAEASPGGGASFFVELPLHPQRDR